MKSMNSMNRFIISVVSSFAIYSCANQDTSIPIAGTQAPDLTTAQGNAVSAISTSTSAIANSAGAVATSTSYSLAFKTIENQIATALSQTKAATQSFNRQTFTSDDAAENCTTSGTVSAAGFYDGSFTVSETEFMLNINGEIDVTFSDCREADALIDGELSGKFKSKIALTGSNSSFSDGTITSSTTISGTVQAQGEDDQNQLQDVSVEFKSFELILKTDYSDLDNFSALFSESGSQSDKINFIKNNVSCKGSVEIDNESYTCAEAIIYAINQELN